VQVEQCSRSLGRGRIILGPRIRRKVIIYEQIRMPALSDAVVIGIVLTLIFAAVSYYLYSRMVQSETKVGLIESILLNLKMATEASLFMSGTEAPPQPPPMRVHKMETKADPADDHVSSSELQEMIDAAQEKVLSNIQEENQVQTQDQDRVPLHVVKDDDGSSRVHIGFESMSWKELCVEAKKRSITGVSHMNRKKLIDILNKREGSVVSSEQVKEQVQEQVQQDEPEMVGTDLASIHDFPENGSPI